MKPIEDHIRKKLGSQSSPPKLDAESLWDSISAGLPEDLEGGTTIPASPIPLWKKWWPLVFGLVLMLIGGSLWWRAANNLPATPASAATVAVTAPQPTTDNLDKPVLQTSVNSQSIA
ncbi:MAG: hypothetical protein AAF597_04075, partial [Bacteroidota bacterium]